MGPVPFSTADQASFFGRDEEIRALEKAWRSNQITILHGAAGVGKSSLLCAGVLPLMAAHGHVLPLGSLPFPAAVPLASMPETNLHVFGLLSSWQPEEMPSRLPNSSVLDVVRRNVLTDHSGRRVPVFAVIDQFEAIFRQADPPEIRLRRSLGRQDEHRGRLFEQLAEALNTEDALHLIISVRSDRLDETREQLVRCRSEVEVFELRPLTRAAAVEAVRGPLRGSRHPLDEDAERLVDELRTIRLPDGRSRESPTADPALLQIVSAWLWDELPGGADQGIEQLPDEVDRILAEHASGALAVVAAEHRVPARRILEWFRARFGGTSTEVREDVMTRELPNGIARAVADLPLLGLEKRADHRYYVLRNERLRAVIPELEVFSAQAGQRSPSTRLRAAESAFTAGELNLSRRRIEAVADAGAGSRLLGAIECLLGNIAYELDQWDSAIAHYGLAAARFAELSEAPRVGLLLTAMGRLKIRRGSTSEAIRWLQSAVYQLPDDSFIKAALATALWTAGRTDAALGVLDDALSHRGDAAEALRLRGELLADLDMPEPALRDLARVPHDDRLSTRTAWALAKKSCEPAFDAGHEQEIGDDSGPVLLRVARLRQLEGDSDAAAELAIRAMQADDPPLPDHLHQAALRLIEKS